MAAGRGSAQSRQISQSRAGQTQVNKGTIAGVQDMFKKLFGQDKNEAEQRQGFDTPGKRFKDSDIFRAGDRPYSRQMHGAGQQMDLFSVDIPDPMRRDNQTIRDILALGRPTTSATGTQSQAQAFLFGSNNPRQNASAYGDTPGKGGRFTKA